MSLASWAAEDLETVLAVVVEFLALLFLVLEKSLDLSFSIFACILISSIVWGFNCV